MTRWKTIEGETPIDPSDLRNPSNITTRGELSKAEAANINSAFVKYLAARPNQRLAPFDYGWLLRLHREMFGDVWLWAGKTRTRDLNLGSPHFQVTEHLAALVDDLHSWTEFGHSIEQQAVWLHHRAVRIHPFPNGNGRWARLASNIWLARNAKPLVLWPDQVLGSTSIVRNEYLAALRAADAGSDSDLIALHARFTGS